MTDPTGSHTGGRRAANVILWCLQVVATAVFVSAALPKLTAAPQEVASFSATGMGSTGMYLTGAAEMVALLIP